MRARATLLAALLLAGCGSREAYVVVKLGRVTCRGTTPLPTESVVLRCSNGVEELVPWAELWP